MHLLVCVQAVDNKDTAVSFIIGWLEEMSRHFDSITVLCLRKGAYDLPANVEVVYLGTSRPGRAWRLLSESFARRRRYDAVFVHQGQEFILVAGWLWGLLRKPAHLWRNHYAGSWLTHVAALFCKKVFYTSKHSYTARFPNAVQMPIGIDTSLYRPVQSIERKPHSILFYARLSPSKRPDVLLEALNILRAKGIEFNASFYGTPLPKDEPYLAALKERATSLALPVEFHPGRPHAEGPAIFSAHEVFVNLAASGMYDKMIFEAASCGCLVLTSIEDFASDAGEDFVFTDMQSLAQKLQNMLSLPAEERRARLDTLSGATSRHGIRNLGERLAEEMRPLQRS